MTELKSHKALQDFFDKLKAEFDLPTAQYIMRIFIQTFGGLRVLVPTIDYICKIERNKRICNLFRCGNYKELAARFNLSVSQIRRIVHWRKD